MLCVTAARGCTHVVMYPGPISVWIYNREDSTAACHVQGHTWVTAYPKRGSSSDPEFQTLSHGMHTRDAAQRCSYRYNDAHKECACLALRVLGSAHSVRDHTGSPTAKKHRQRPHSLFRCNNTCAVPAASKSTGRSLAALSAVLPYLKARPNRHFALGQYGNHVLDGR